MKKPLVSLIIPTYNEAENIRKLIPEIEQYLKGIAHELIVVDDNSPDGTWKIAGTFKNVRVIRRIGERGLATAVIRGFHEAKADVIGVMDADQSHPPKKLLELIKPLLQKKAGVVIGSRLIPGGSVENWPFIRKMTAWGARILARPLTPVKDVMSGFFFFQRNVIKGVELKPVGYKILLEILVKGHYHKALEIAYVFRNREVGHSKLNANEYWNYVRHLVRLYTWKLFKV
ncbi:MAG TPA: polyprenol monophosphomannose synthase [Candidatus Nanoarchaeia archaeon]|nr:polyprenol monophosphomannose synthase [Candidatus Nanoarchaeia archaeon]